MNRAYQVAQVSITKQLEVTIIEKESIPHDLAKKTEIGASFYTGSGLCERFLLNSDGDEV